MLQCTLVEFKESQILFYFATGLLGKCFILKHSY